MSMRPVPAHWFEVLVARDDLPAAVEALARTRQVELESESKATRFVGMPDLQGQLDEYSQLSQGYRHYWPKNDLHVSAIAKEPVVRLNQSLDHLYRWKQDADPLIRCVEQLHSEQEELKLITLWLKELYEWSLDFSVLCGSGPVLSAQLFVIPEKENLQQFPPSLLINQIRSGEHLFLFAVGAVGDVEQLQAELLTHKGRVLPLPPWLKGDAKQTLSTIRQKIEEDQVSLDKLWARLDDLHEKHNLKEALGDIQQLEWFLANVSELPVTENFGWLVGWTSESDASYLQSALEGAEVRAVVSFPAAPEGRMRPLVMQNPSWIKPFEIFAGMLGTPGENEADPAPLLAVIVPLVFGYMFGDVGHGFLLVVAGWFLRKHWPVLKILVVCGISSIVFGFVFGSVFGNEHLIDPLWVNPVQQPLPVLMAPLAGGAVLLLLGLTLNSVQAWWRGEFYQWLMTEAPVIGMYLSLIAALFTSWAAIFFGAAFCWYLAGSLLTTDSNYLKQLLVSLGVLLENLLQLVINTVSFIRVGAFALAHSGLSLAFVIMADASSNIFVTGFILLLGNAIVILLEGLVVSIQTTRLVLFEFFIRFLRGTGRKLHPLKAPQNSHLQPTRRT